MRGRCQNSSKTPWIPNICVKTKEGKRGGRLAFRVLKGYLEAVHDETKMPPLCGLVCILPPSSSIRKAITYLPDWHLHAGYSTMSSYHMT